AGAGYDLARSTVYDRTSLDVPSDEASGRLQKQVLSKPLTADGAARIALANSANVQVALSNVGVSRADLMAALRLPNPHAELGVHFHGDEVDLELKGTV